MMNSKKQLGLIDYGQVKKLSKEERLVAEELENYFRIPADNRDLNYNKYFSEGQKDLSQIEEYNSFNTTRLNKEELINLLASIGYKE